MSNLKGSKTEQNLKDAFAGESMANRRYLYFASKADVEGYNDVSAVFRSTAEGETGHAHGHLEYLEEVRRSGHRPAVRRHRGQPEVGHRRRDPRVHRHVPGHGQGRPRGRLRRDRRLVRDPGQGRALARQPLPEGAGRAAAEPDRAMAAPAGIAASPRSVDAGDPWRASAAQPVPRAARTRDNRMAEQPSIAPAKATWKRRRGIRSTG